VVGRRVLVVGRTVFGRNVVGRKLQRRMVVGRRLPRKVRQYVESRKLRKETRRPEEKSFPFFVWLA